VRRRAAAVLALGFLVAAPAAGQSPSEKPDPSIANGSAQRKLDTARRHWRRARIPDYRFELERLCFCAQRGPVVLFVRHGRPVDPPAALRSVATVRRLHRVVQRAIDHEVAGLSVRYGRRGVPRSIGIDGHRMTADDEVSYRVEHFWRGLRAAAARTSRLRAPPLADAAWVTGQVVHSDGGFR
jgi:Family of unknown function (DUF6174)